MNEKELNKRYDEIQKKIDDAGGLEAYLKFRAYTSGDIETLYRLLKQASKKELIEKIDALPTPKTEKSEVLGGDYFTMKAFNDIVTNLEELKKILKEVLADG